MAGIIRTLVAPHTPRTGIEEQAPDFSALRAGMQIRRTWS